MEITVEEVNGEVLVMAYTGRAGTDETIYFTKIAKDIGALPIDIMNRLTQEYDNFVALKQTDLNQLTSSHRVPGSTVSRCTNRHKPRRVKGCGGCG